MFPTAESRVARQASRIADPVERLRFLRSRSRQRLTLSHLLLAMLLCVMLLPARSVMRTAPPAAPETAKTPAVWLVEDRNGFELYSNGLSVEAAGATRHHSRRYRVYEGGRSSWVVQPAGIVYHSTESDVLAYDGHNNTALLRKSESVLEYVRRRKAYHYLIDRFGQVHRTVAEQDSADHAGNSAWAWEGKLCLNLNHAFLGVSFEARTDEPLNDAQLHSGRVLTEMLRARYGIRPENCVAHAQVSVNPANRRIGWHTDWARNLPFASLGLPDNYAQPLPPITELGFSFDPGYLEAAGEGLWIGVHRSEAQLKRAAANTGEAVPVYKRRLARRYEDLVKKGDS